MEIMHGHHGSLAGLGSVDLEALEERPWLFCFRDIPHLCNTPQFSSLCFTGVELHRVGFEVQALGPPEMYMGEEKAEELVDRSCLGEIG